MSPRRPAALAASDTSLRDHLIATAARLIDKHVSRALTVRDIAREAHVADGVLYNHFADKDELLAHALAAHVHTVMESLGDLPRPGENTVEENLRTFVSRGLDVLTRIMPAFNRFLTQPAVITHVREWALNDHGDDRALPGLLTEYLRAEQGLGRLDPDADPQAAAALLIGACHELTLPHLFLSADAEPPEIPAGFVESLVATVLHGIAPR